MSLSPLIVDGDLQLSPSGDLQVAPDIETQMPVTLTAYNCIYNTEINSQVIPYLDGIPANGFRRNTLTNLIAEAYQLLIVPRIITNLQIAVGDPIQNYVKINIFAVDNEGTEVKFGWINPN